jgi:hypothetical protein
LSQNLEEITEFITKITQQYDGQVTQVRVGIDHRLDLLEIDAVNFYKDARSKDIVYKINKISLELKAIEENLINLGINQEFNDYRNIADVSINNMMQITNNIPFFVNKMLKLSKYIIYLIMLLRPKS